MQLEIDTSTGYERLSLEKGINLSDGHTRQPPTDSQLAIIGQLPEIYSMALSRGQMELEREFTNEFFLAAAQHSLDTNRCLLSYSASTAITLIAQYIQSKSLSVALIHPAFDNIPGLLRSHKVPLIPISEESLLDQPFPGSLESLRGDVVWIVCPNNPTGFELSEPGFTELVSYCARHKKLLVLDFCFRFFSSHLLTWDQYAILDASGVSYITIEDTGKTWPTLDMKIGIMICNPDLYAALYQLHDDLLLNISPFHLTVLTEFIRDTRQQGLDVTLRHQIRENRVLLRKALEGSTLIPTVHSLSTTMEWLRIDAPYTGQALWKELKKRDIHILPGSHFFWVQRELGDRFVRIPLTRSSNLIAMAAPLIRSVSDDLVKAYRQY